MEFILPFGRRADQLPTRASSPVLGYSDEVGIDDDNRHDSKEYRDDFYEGQTDSFVGSRTPFTTRITITGPADFTLNSVGTKTEDTVKDGRRTVVWESDHPVSFFNVVAGRWTVKRGEGTAVYYHPGHPYNIAEMLEAPRRRPPLLLRVVLSLSLARAEAQRVSQPGDLRPGFPDQHHVLRRDRLPDQEHARDPRRLRDHRARGSPPVVGQHPDAGQGPRGQHPGRGDVALLDDPAASSRSRA